MIGTRARFAMAALAAAVGLSFLAQPAWAIKPFKDAFEEKYVKADSKAPAEAALATAAKEAKCGICHGKSKKDRNAYGAELDKLLDKDQDKDNKQKIADALDKVAGMKSNPKDAKSPTFGEVIAKGKLPCAK